MATVRENLIAAKALIDTPDKWCKGPSFLFRGARCAIGAVESVTNLEEGGWISDTPEYKELFLALPRGGPYYSVHKFNDAPETTHADIMALFQRAIDAQVEE